MFPQIIGVMRDNSGRLLLSWVNARSGAD